METFNVHKKVQKMLKHFSIPFLFSEIHFYIKIITKGGKADYFLLAL